MRDFRLNRLVPLFLCLRFLSFYPCDPKYNLTKTEKKQKKTMLSQGHCTSCCVWFPFGGRKGCFIQNREGRDQERAPHTHTHAHTHTTAPTRPNIQIYTIYAKVCGHPFKFVDSAISAIPVADRCIKSSTQP